MTKVSWKRILQRAGNDLPSHGRPMQAPPQMHSAPRSARASESPSMIAGELETELRRALQRAQGAANSEPEQPAWDPIFVAREIRHTPPAVPVANYRHDIQGNGQRGGGISTRNIVVASISAVMVGFAAYQVGMLGGGGGGGSGGGSGEQQQSQSAAGPAVVAKEQQKLIETGYAIQPMLQAGNPTDLGPVNKETPSLMGDRASAQPDNSTSDAAAIFERDMEEAVKLFEEKQAPVTTKKAEPARRKTPEPATASTRAAPAPAAEEPLAAAPAASTRLSAVATTPAPAMPALSGQEEESLLQRASGLMKRGDVTGARLLFEHLAYRGSALGAFALAQSYDPRYLSKIYVRGLAADQKQADFWYRRAAELGGTGQSAAGRR